MLYQTFNSLKESLGENYFKGRVNPEIIQNLNPKFQLRQYQKEALGRFDFYFKEYQKKKWPAHLLFHMATGSGKTLIMAGCLLYLYQRGYRNFIFFVNNTNIIEKTRDNFLNLQSEKYLFAQKIKFGEKEVFIREVKNFDEATPDDINIIFTTIQSLHTRLNQPKENALTEEDFEDKNIVLISDEAHHLQTLTKNQSKEEEEIEKSWEYSVIKKIFEKNFKNILLEFTATIDLTDQNIYQKYQDKIILQYDLKQFRIDGFSKEIEVVQAELELVERMIIATILSQYRQKVAEKNRLYLKPVILFKSKSIKESKENYEKFLEKIKNLRKEDLEKIKKQSSSTGLTKAFLFFEKEKISFENLIRELQEDFSEEKVMLLDSENIDEEKQLKLNSLENINNQIRAIFAVNMLNEGWDVLNLFDIVRLYDTRDGKWDRRTNKYKPGKTTIGEAQLIGRGARYWPYKLKDEEDIFKRKFDNDLENELRILETLHYHCLHNPRYIDEIKSTLTEIGLIPEKYIQKELFVKEKIKKSDFWENGIIYLNEKILNDRKEVKSFKDINIQKEYEYELKTGLIKEELIFENKRKDNNSLKLTTKVFALIDFGENIIRSAIDQIKEFSFDNLKSLFPNIKSIKQFINDENYLSQIKIKIKGPEEKIKKILPKEKLEIAFFILKEILNQAKNNVSAYKGSDVFKAQFLKEIFRDKIVKVDKEKNAEEVEDINLEEKDWFAQNGFVGTTEEKNFIKFIDEVVNDLRKKYSDIVLIRNEKFFQLFDFEEGRAFEPDFVLFLKEKNHKIVIYQIFIEPKGDQFKDEDGRFSKSKEGWKEKFLLELENKAQYQLRIENQDFRLLGLPFYNKVLETKFKEKFEEKFL